jgi:parallel beta-helix repeat protein
LLFILCFSFAFFPGVILVEAQESSIIIRNDGKIEGTDKIQHEGNLYTFTGAIQGQIVVQRERIVVDGAGYALEYLWGNRGLTVNANGVTIKGVTVTPTGGKSKLGGGIYLNQTSNCEITNCTVTGNHIGVIVFQSLGTRISYNTIANNTSSGISVNYKDATIIGNHITGNGNGIDFIDYAGNTVTENQIENNIVGINCLMLSTLDTNLKNEIYENNFINNTYHFSSSVMMFPFHMGNVFEKNLVGNYWDDYNGTDTNNDGIGDTPYVLSGPNQDRFPLINPIEIATIPEFSSWTILPIILNGLVVVAVYRKKLKH